MAVRFVSAVLISLVIVSSWASVGGGALAGARVFAQEEESADPMVTLTADGVVRAWPSSSADILGAIPTRSAVPVTGRTVDFTWWQIAFSSGPDGRAWVAATVVRPNDAAASVPIIQVIQPTPTPVAPTPEPTPSTCTLDAAFVADVTVPDGTVLLPTEAVNKVWRLRNTGTCAWENVTVLKFVGGFQMGSPATADVPYTPPGETADIGITAYAPAQGGQYRSAWQLQDEGVNFFGPKVTMVINVNSPVPPKPVPAPVQPTPVPPAPPKPVPAVKIDFAVDPSTIVVGDCTVVGWKVKNAAKVEYNDGKKWHSVKSEDLRDACPTKTASLKLRVTDKGGGTHERSQKVTVLKLLK